MPFYYMLVRRAALLLGSLFILFAITVVPGYAQVSDGDIIVIDYLIDAVIKVDPNTGDRTILSGGITSPVGSGPAFIDLQGLSVDEAGNIWVTDLGDASNPPSVVKVDPVTGQRTPVSSSTVGSGPSLTTPTDVISNPNGTSLWVIDDNEILQIDPATGVRVLASNSCAGAAAIQNPVDMAIDSSGNLWLINGNGYIVRLTSSGGCAVINDPQYGAATGITVDDNGEIFVVENNAIYKITDPVTGARQEISGSCSSQLVNTEGIALDEDGNLVIISAGGFIGLTQVPPAVLKLDIASGSCTIVSDTNTGSGPDFSGPVAIFVDPPTLVELLTFIADLVNGQIAFGWRTAAEIDNAGFNIYGGSSPSGPWVKLNDGLIAAQGSPLEEAGYSHAEVTAAGMSYYMLEDVDLFGARTQHGPIQVNGAVTDSQVEMTEKVFVPLIR